MIPDTAQLSAISRLFSSAVFREMAKRGHSSIFARLIKEIQFGQRWIEGATVGDAFEEAFAMLRRVGRRDEYVYRAALTRNILLGTHSLNTASMLNEFRTGECKADLVILNGTATAYEIKSERDSLSRLARQVENYRKVFAKTFVIASEGHIASVLDTVPDDVGVMCLRQRFQISIVRDAIDRPDQICAKAVFDSLRLAESRIILNKAGIDVPDLPNTKLHAVMRETFGQLRPTEVHKAMVETLKRTRNLASLGALIDRLPNSLHAAALSIQVRRADHERLVNAMRTPLDTAIGWA